MNNECEVLSTAHWIKKVNYYTYSRTINVITAWLISFIKTWQKCLLDCKGMHIRYTNMMLCPITEKASLCFCQIIYQEILSMKKNMSSDLENLEIRLDVVDIAVSTYIPQSALKEIAQATKSDTQLRDITEFIVHGWPETDAGLPEDL